ncbi:MAG: Fic family protein [Candidatus Obscuribacterales bacterium]
MGKRKADNGADLLAVMDRGERESMMEPTLIGAGSNSRIELADIALELAQASASLRGSIAVPVADSLADLVRNMNCYYSNLIEGHNTHPVDIERALKKDYSRDSTKRNLQLEAFAHVSVQKWIDTGHFSGLAYTADGIREIHRRFCELLPEELLYLEDPQSGERVRVEAGQFRDRDIAVGAHVAISPGAVPRFTERFAEVYNKLGKSESVLACAAAHHRLLWIHPFLDGNGRVARLVSYAVLRDVLDSRGLWSIARGLARNQSEYKRHLMLCDQQRMNDYDGRGNLSERALVEFTRFFLQVCLDQVRFMSSLIQPDTLGNRITRWVEVEAKTERLLSNSSVLLQALLLRGELERGEVPAILGLGERQARRVVAALAARGAVSSETERGPLRLAFPAALAETWLPGLFPTVS